MSDARPTLHARPSRLVLLGHPVSHSLSPRFQQAALDAAALPVRYEAVDAPPAQLATTLAALAHERAAGNVTIPHKEAVFAACAVRSDVAVRVGAVNTFAHDAAGRLCGHNTDVAGALAAMRAVLGPRPPARVVVLGAGGSAAAVLEALRLAGTTHVALAARTLARAEALAARAGLSVTTHAMPDGARAPHASVPNAGVPNAGVPNAGARRAGAPSGTTPAAAALRAALRDADLVVNTTPRGLTDDALPVEPSALGAHTAVLDLVYRPGETPWVHACRAAGHAAEDGLRMLVEQGAEAWAWWFGVVPDREAMWRVLEPRPFRPSA